jgi:hypothetical protein
MPMNAAMRCSMMMISARNQPVMLTVVAFMSFTLLGCAVEATVEGLELRRHRWEYVDLY